MRTQSAAKIINSKNMQASFNKRHDQYKAVAEQTGMRWKEWDDNGFKCFSGRMGQEDLKAGKGVYSHCEGYLVDVFGKTYARIEYAIAGGHGRIHSICIHQQE